MLSYNAKNLFFYISVITSKVQVYYVVETQDFGLDKWYVVNPLHDIQNVEGKPQFYS